MAPFENFFGIEEDKIRQHFYKKNKSNTLFGEGEEMRKITEPVEKVALLYCERLKTIWEYVTEKPLVLMNNKNAPIYHFVFASNNKIALKIAKDIIRRK